MIIYQRLRGEIEKSTLLIIKKVYKNHCTYPFFRTLRILKDLLFVICFVLLPSALSFYLFFPRVRIAFITRLF